MKNSIGVIPDTQSQPAIELTLNPPINTGGFHTQIQTLFDYMFVI